MIDTDTCRKSLNKDLTNSQVEDVRSRLYSLAKLVVNKYIELKALFINSLQTVTCKGRIVKPE